MRFEDEADEESYKALRERERRTVSLHNYAEEYCSRTEYGDLVLQQRSQMVHWIVEVSASTDVFLHVSIAVVGSKIYFVLASFLTSQCAPR